MKMLRYTAIGITILFLLCGTALTAEKTSKANVSATQQGAIAPQASMAQKAAFSRIVVDNVTTNYYEELNLRATLSDQDGKPLGGKTITFSIYSGSTPIQFQTGPTPTKLYSETSPAGVATGSNRAYFFAPEPGIYVIEASFAGNATAPAASHKGQLTINKSPTAIKDISVYVPEPNGSRWTDVNPVKMYNTYNIYGQLISANNNPVGINGQQVAISANGVFLQNCTTGADPAGWGSFLNCRWKIPGNATPVDYIMTFEFEGDKHYLPTTATKKIRAVP
jgi:hypothetical protein